MPTAENSVWNLINELSNKKGITEIVVNDPKTVFVERDGQFIQLKVELKKTDIYSFIEEVAKYNKKECNADHPVLDGNLPDGSRINAILEPYAKGSPAITIRKYLKNIKRFDSSPDIFGLDEKWVEFLKGLVAARMNIMVSGGTGAGKTTFLNLLLQEVSGDERVVTIEDTLELNFNLPNVVRLEASKETGERKALSIQDLLKNSLRMRPDRIIIGESRSGELFDLLQAMNTGHEGSMSSIHASSPGECISRMETLYLLAGYEVPNHVVRKQIGSAVDFIIQISRSKEGKRIVSHVSEITGMEGSNVLMQHIGLFEDGAFKSTGLTPKNMAKINERANLPLNFFS